MSAFGMTHLLLCVAGLSLVVGNAYANPQPASPAPPTSAAPDVVDSTALNAAATPVVATMGRFCFYPRTAPFAECSKGIALSEADVTQCEQALAKRKKRPPRIRIDGGAWLDFSADHWRCVEVPVATQFRYQLENYGRLFRSDRTSIDNSCKSHRIDLTAQNWYTAINTKCSKRTTNDEVIAHEPVAPAPPPVPRK